MNYTIGNANLSKLNSSGLFFTKRIFYRIWMRSTMVILILIGFSLSECL